MASDVVKKENTTPRPTVLFTGNLWPYLLARVWTSHENTAAGEVWRGQCPSFRCLCAECKDKPLATQAEGGCLLSYKQFLSHGQGEDSRLLQLCVPRSFELKFWRELLGDALTKAALDDLRAGSHIVLLPVASAVCVGMFPEPHFCLSLKLPLTDSSRGATSAVPAPAEPGQPPTKVQVMETGTRLVPWQQWQTRERQRVIEEGAKDSVIGSLYLW